MPLSRFLFPWTACLLSVPAPWTAASFSPPSSSRSPRTRGRGLPWLGAADNPDGVERGAVVKGNRLDIEEGKLRVIDHEGGFVGKVFVPAWTEIRLENVGTR